VDLGMAARRGLTGGGRGRQAGRRDSIAWRAGEREARGEWLGEESAVRRGRAPALCYCTSSAKKGDYQHSEPGDWFPDFGFVPLILAQAYCDAERHRNGNQPDNYRFSIARRVGS
jgi:hypothetical protein